jgi:hypothetical protein
MGDPVVYKGMEPGVHKYYLNQRLCRRVALKNDFYIIDNGHKKPPHFFLGYYNIILRGVAIFNSWGYGPAKPAG